MIIVFLNILFVIIGFVLHKYGLSDTEHYHGPNASEVMKYVYHDVSTNKYYKFDIKMYICPPSRKTVVRV